jgi:DNA-directed RNA polymerase subunit RPC12/RpoP
MEAHIVQGRLEEDGIKCWLKDENTVTLNPIWTQAVGGIKLMVAEPQVERAAELMKELEKERRSRFVCPKCASGNIELISSVRRPGSLLSALSTFFLSDYPLADKIYHCFNCTAEFKEPVEKGDNEPL